MMSYFHGSKSHVNDGMTVFLKLSLSQSAVQAKKGKRKRAKEKLQLQIDCSANRATTPSLAKSSFGQQWCLLCSDVFCAVMLKNIGTWKFVKTNFLIPEDTAFFSSKASIE